MKPGTPEGRLRQYIMITARRHGHDPAWVYAGGSGLLGRTLTAGFGLTSCSKPELIQIADWVTAATGGTPGRHRRGERTRPLVAKDRSGAVVYLATPAQKDLIRSLGTDVWGSVGDGSLFGAFCRRLVGTADLRMLTGDKARKLIEALTAMQQRGWKPRGTGSDRSDPSDRSNHQEAV